MPVRCLAERPGSLVELLGGSLATYADRVLLLDPALGRAVTYGEFARLVEGASTRLLREGLQPGDRVAVSVANGLEAAVAIWACARAGLVHLGLPAGMPPARAGALLALTRPRLLLTQPDLADAAAEAVVTAGLRDTPLAPATDMLLTDELPWDHDRPLPDTDETYCLIGTSGTSGSPKAVRVTGRMVGHAAEHYAGLLALGPADRTAIHLPFAWVSGHVTQLAPTMRSGGSAVTMAAFTAAGLIRTAAEHGVTWIDVVPSIWELLLREGAAAATGLAGVRAAVFGGAPAAPGTLERVRGLLPGITLHDIYALSETCAAVTVLPDGEAAAHPGTVGRVVPFAELRLAEPVDGLPAAPGAAPPEVGELQIRGAAVTPGYWGDADPSPLTSDGWLRTRDLAGIDAQGYVTIAGRASDVVIRGGVNVHPAEIERALLGHGGLADAAVVGVPSVLAGETLAAAVVLLPGVSLDAPGLQRAVREQVGAHAVPRPLRAVDALPRNRNGKVDREALRALLTR